MINGFDFSKENSDTFNRYTLASQAYEAIKVGHKGDWSIGNEQERVVKLRLER